MFANEKLDIVICDATSVNRKPVQLWHEDLLWVVRSDIAVNTAEALPIILFESTCPWSKPCLEALSDRKLHWKIVCEASTLVAMATAVRVGIGIGPMIAATIPNGCRALDRAADLPAPVRIGIGLYMPARVPEEARYLADFVGRQSNLGSWTAG